MLIICINILNNVETNGTAILINSNTVIDYLSGKILSKGKVFMDKVINNIPNISVLTKIKVLGFKTKESANHLLKGFIDGSVGFGLSDKIVEITIEIMKEYKIKTPDAVVAATALQSNLALINNDARGFKNIKGLDIINPHES